MLGKLHMKDEPDKAREYFQQVRQLTKNGFADAIGLATASLGLEARVNLDDKKFEKAIELYLEQLAAGDNSAIQSLRIAANLALESNEMDGSALAPLAKNPKTQRVITAYLISFRSEYIDHPYAEKETTDSFGLRWLRSVELAKVNDVESAEKLALVAYQDGSFAEAQRWINRATGSPLTQWLQAKLFLRDGKIAQAAALLAKVSASFPIEDRGTNAPVILTDNLFVPFLVAYRSPRGLGAQVLGELGTLQLTRQQYTQALDSMLRSGFWQDAAYVAERVLTLDELKRYVDQNWPAPVMDTNELGTADFELSPQQLAENVRYLLARRLTRSQRGFEARPYFPESWQPQFDQLATALNEGWNEALPQEQRAKAFLAAAMMVRTNGLELTGAELGPDWFVSGGNFPYGVSLKTRTNESFAILRPTVDESQRAAKHAPDPDVRFHYRHQAAFLAWEAARMMANNTVETARVLCIAGSWIKHRDPDTADLFYKALVKRCRKTDIGDEADRIRWFPELDENGDLIPRIVASANVLTGPLETESTFEDSPALIEPHNTKDALPDERQNP